MLAIAVVASSQSFIRKRRSLEMIDLNQVLPPILLNGVHTGGDINTPTNSTTLIFNTSGIVSRVGDNRGSLAPLHSSLGNPRVVYNDPNQPVVGLSTRLHPANKK